VESTKGLFALFRNGVKHNSDRDRYDSMQRRRSSSTEDERRGLLQRRL